MSKEIKVGDYIRGFKYDGKSYNSYMDLNIGQVGKVIDVFTDAIKVRFNNNRSAMQSYDFWLYPKDQALEHLANDDIKEFEKAMIENTDESYTKDNITPSKLYSILLSKGNQRIIYIDLTELELNVKKDKYNDYHCIVIEQGNDKGIKIDLRY